MQAVKKIEYLASNWPEKKKEEGVKTPWLIHPIRFGFQTIGRLFPKAAGKLTYTLFTTPRRRAHHRISDPTLEKAKIFEVLFAKQVLKGYSWGKGKKTILLVHGWESRGTAMRGFVKPFVEAGYRVVALDGPAHGNSEGRRTNLPEFAKAIRAFIHHVGPIDAAICHSFGGVAMMYALSQLELDTQVRRVVTISSPNDMRLMLKQATDFMRVPKPAQKHFRTIIEYKMLMPVAKASLGKWGNSITTEDILIVHDEEDRVVPVSEALAIFESIDQASVLISKGYGHYQITKNPDVIRRVTQFIMEPQGFHFRRDQLRHLREFRSLGSSKKERGSRYYVGCLYYMWLSEWKL